MTSISQNHIHTLNQVDISPQKQPSRSSQLILTQIKYPIKWFVNNTVF